MLRVPFAAVTDFVDPAVDFSLKFQANGAENDGHEEHDEPENDAPDRRSGVKTAPTSSRWTSPARNKPVAGRWLIRALPSSLALSDRQLAARG